MPKAVHEVLSCGLEYGVTALADRHLVSFQFRLLAGIANEPADRLGLAKVVEETLDKGTQRFSARELADAFDAIGAGCQGGTGRETMTFTCTVLPEHFERAVELHAEFLRRPTFPDEAMKVNIALSKQEIKALDDDAQAIMDKLISRQAYGATLGRHALGEPAMLDRIERRDVERFWKEMFSAGRMIAVVGGAVSPERAKEVLTANFDGFGPAARNGRHPFPLEFTATTTHHAKELEQEHIAICWPGVDAKHDDFPIQQVTLGILSGGMSGRLFTEVREKRGLVYWVSAWQDTPRGAGMVFLGASTTPERCDQTYETLLGEVDRLADDLTEEELERAITGIVSQQVTRGDSTRARCGELGSDLFFFGRPVPTEEKLDKIRRVTLVDIQRYLRENPRDRLCAMTLGPRPLDRRTTENRKAGIAR